MAITRQHFNWAAEDIAESHNVGDIDTADFLTVLYWADRLFDKFGPAYDGGRFVSETLRRAGFDTRETVRSAAADIRQTRTRAVTLCEDIAANSSRSQLGRIFDRAVAAVNNSRAPAETAPETERRADIRLSPDVETLLRDLLDWEETLGGFEAPVWGRLRDAVRGRHNGQPIA